MPDPLKDKVILISGATSGLGRELALLSGERYTQLLLIGRNLQALEELKSQIQKLYPCQVSLFVADYISGYSVKNAAQDILKAFKKIDVVIHNVGALYSHSLVLENGIDRMYQVNYLSHYILAESLFAGNCQVNQMIFVGSDMKGGGLEFLQKEKSSFDIRKTYAGSKLALNLYAAFLSGKYPEMHVNCFQPGRLKTGIGSKSTHFLHAFYWKMMQLFASDTKVYAEEMLNYIEENADKKRSGFSIGVNTITELRSLPYSEQEINQLLDWSREKYRQLSATNQ